MTAPSHPGTEGNHLEHRGCQLWYKVRGKGIPILFIQGSGLHGDGWNPQVDALKEHYSCLTFDNRGMGKSQPYGAPITVPQLAEDAFALMDAVGWQSAHIIGHSLGGLIAQHMALSAPNRARSLSLLCTFSRGKDATKLSWGMIWLGLRMFLGTRKMRRRAFTQLVLPPELQKDADAWAERLAPFFGHDLADQPPVVMKQLSAMSAYDATRNLSRLVDIPTLVVGAEHDRIARPEIVRTLAANIPGSRLVELANASHGVPLHNSDKINTLLEEHISHAEGNFSTKRHG